jgi:hypothetical protein
MLKHINKWIDYLSCPQDLLTGLAICPFAKKAKFQLIRTHTNKIIPPDEPFEIIIFLVEDNITFVDLTAACKSLNKKYPQLVFLPDHKNRDTYIKGLKTNNGKYNLILCQYRDQLEKARELLKHTDYYKFWDKGYLKEIMEM